MPWTLIAASARSLPARAVAIGATILLVAAAFFSGSRTGVGGILLGGSLTLFLRHRAGFLLGIAVLGFGVGLLSFQRGELDVDLEEGATGRLVRTQTISRLSGRLELWEEGFARFSESPWIGHGFGWSRTADADAGGRAPLGAAGGHNFHSQHVETLVDLGLAGEALLLATLVGIALRGARLARRDRPPAAAAVGAAFLGTFTVATLDLFFHNWFLTPGTPLAYLVWSLVAIAFRLERVTRPSPGVPPRPPAPALSEPLEPAGVRA